MKRTSMLTILTVLLPAACDDPSFPPEACGTLDNTEVFIGEQQLVALCFHDPDGDAVTVAAIVSDPSVVEAGVEGGRQAILLTGKDAGNAVITVTAQDPTGLSSAAQMFTVTVPNRVPEVTEVLPDITLTDDAPEASLTLTEYFTDPDGHALAFSAAVSDETVIRTVVTDNTLQVEVGLEVERVRRGSALVRLTAKDPHGASVSGDARVRLRPTGEILNDEFESLSDDWERKWVDAEIVDGRLKLASAQYGFGANAGFVSHPVDKTVDWTVTTNTEYVTVDMWPGLGIAIEGENLQAIAVLFGANIERMTRQPGVPETNLVVLTDWGEGWIGDLSWSGMFDEIAGKDTPMDVGVSFYGGSLKVLVDDAVVHEVRFTDDETVPTATAVALVAWPSVGLESLDGSEQTYFDWISVTGTPIGANPDALGFFPRPSSVRIIR